MTTLNHDTIRIFRRIDIDASFQQQWNRLFQHCFRTNAQTSQQTFQKYLLNDPFFCCLYRNNMMIAAYCGLKLTYENGEIFVGTDVMSDGSRRGASIILGKNLYKTLTLEGVSIVCGYPNANMRTKCERDLGWTLSGELYLYISLPFLWRLARKPLQLPSPWAINRPTGGWFSRKRPLFIDLLVRNTLYTSGFGVVLTLAAYRPGTFFARVPRFIFKPRTFGYVILNDIPALTSSFVNQIPFLDVATIDIP